PPRGYQSLTGRCRLRHPTKEQAAIAAPNRTNVDGSGVNESPFESSCSACVTVKTTGPSGNTGLLGSKRHPPSGGGGVVGLPLTSFRMMPKCPDAVQLKSALTRSG